MSCYICDKSIDRHTSWSSLWCYVALVSSWTEATHVHLMLNFGVNWNSAFIANISQYLYLQCGRGIHVGQWQIERRETSSWCNSWRWSARSACQVFHTRSDRRRLCCCLILCLTSRCLHTNVHTDNKKVSKANKSRTLLRYSITYHYDLIYLSTSDENQ